MSKSSDLLRKMSGGKVNEDLLTSVDCLVVGAGPAGLTAGIYASRYLRSVLVVDAGNPRASWIPTSRNFPAWPQGIHGFDLLNLIRVQALEFGAVIEQGRVSTLSGTDGNFVATVNGRTVKARTVLIATGITNLRPSVIDEPTRDRATALRVMRWCPICDPPDLNSKIAVVGSYNHGLKEALFMRTYTHDITIVPVTSDDLSEEDKATCDSEGIKYVESGIKNCYAAPNSITINYQDGTSDSFVTMYPSLGSKVNNELLLSMGCNVDENGNALVNDHCMTNVPGLYAAGDIVAGLDQIDVSTSQASIATTDMHNRMRQADSPLPADQVVIPIMGGQRQL